MTWAWHFQAYRRGKTEDNGGESMRGFLLSNHVISQKTSGANTCFFPREFPCGVCRSPVSGAEELEH